MDTDWGGSFRNRWGLTVRYVRVTVYRPEPVAVRYFLSRHEGSRYAMDAVAELDGMAEVEPFATTLPARVLGEDSERGRLMRAAAEAVEHPQHEGLDTAFAALWGWYATASPAQLRVEIEQPMPEPCAVVDAAERTNDQTGVFS